jgi:hypothetical protein
VPEPVAGQSQELAVVGQPQEHLGDRERNELGVADLRRGAHTSPFRQEVIHQHVNCREKGVEVGAHEASKVDVAVATPDFGALCRASSPNSGNSESTI